MKSFRQFLEEQYAFETKVHRNPSMSAVKNMAQHGELRFVVDHEDNLHVAAAKNFVHTQIVPEEHHKICGFINHHEGNFSHYALIGRAGKDYLYRTTEVDENKHIKNMLKHSIQKNELQ